MRTVIGLSLFLFFYIISSFMTFDELMQFTPGRAANYCAVNTDWSDWQSGST